MPLSLPHATIDDDVYRGFDIPKVPDANVFTPERFLNENGSLKPSDIESIAFGFGRRICVGRHFADTSLWSIFSKVLTIFNLLRPVDENGEEMNVEPKFTNDIAVHPVPFKCRIERRIPGLDAAGLEQLIGAKP
ncbi:cytochrome P450 [Boletus reticuloceps]|uniref:Cytochrome P450 n=1 Tax=Boletus reticuloceps TaxID=495285 RepID=A0A8I2YTN4_9AGAM|nr:cytochrome P450 [Boletus reticuloceps]